MKLFQKYLAPIPTFPRRRKAICTQPLLAQTVLFYLRHLLKQGLCIALPRWGSWRGPLLCVFVSSWFNILYAQRTEISLNNNWYTRASDTLEKGYDAFEMTLFDPENKWKQVDVPHTWDEYAGYRRMLHGNKHGYAYYLKSFKVPKQTKDKRIFLFFEGVGSYATVWLNGKQVGYHAGGRTTFTLDVTDAI